MPRRARPGRGWLPLGAALLACWAGLAPASGATGDGTSGQPTAGAPRIEVLSADAQRTVLRFVFPLAMDAGSEPRVADLLWRRPGPVVRTATGDSALAPTAAALLALPTTFPRARVLAASWSIAPTEAADPAAAVRLGDVRLLRGVPVAALEVSPLTGDGLLAEVTVAVDHAPEAAFAALLAAGAVAADEGGIPFGAAAVRNPALYSALARGQAARLADAADKDGEHPFLLTDHWIKLEIATTGVHRVTALAMALDGVGSTAVDSRKLRLYRADMTPVPEDGSLPGSWQDGWHALSEVALKLEDADGTWDSGDALLFYAVGPDAWADRDDADAGRLEWREHPYAGRSVYWLTWEGYADESPLPGAPLRMAVVAAPPGAAAPDTVQLARHHFEQNVLEVYGRLLDNWAWDTAIFDRKIVPLSLPSALADSLFLQIDVRSNHRFGEGASEINTARAWLNGGDAEGQVLTASWTVRQEQDSLRIRLAGWTDVVRNGFNSLTLSQESPDGSPSLILDSIDVLSRERLVKAAGQLDVTHWGEQVGTAGQAVDLVLTHPAGAAPVCWDVSDPDVPRALTGQGIAANRIVLGLLRDPGTDVHLVAFAPTEALAPAARSRRTPGDLLRLSGDDDYIVLHDPRLAAPAARLAAHRSLHLPGLDHAPSALAVDEEAVYDAFGAGVKDPFALRNFLKWFWTRGAGRLAYVCLAGDASRDYRGYRNQFEDLLPTWTRTFFPDLLTDYSGYPYATDDALVSFDAPVRGLDVPDLSVGRLTARDLDEAAGMVDRIVTYETDTPPGAWRNRVVFAADDFTQPSSPGSYERVHTLQAIELVDHFVPLTIDAEKLLMIDYDPAPSGVYKPLARLAAKRALNEGTTIFHYIGHGSEHTLADEQLFLTDDIYGLDNGLHRGIFLAFSCDVGIFDSAVRQSMAEVFVSQSAGGTIGAIAASQVSYVIYNDPLSDRFYANLYPGRVVDPGRAPGAALWLAKVGLGDSNTQMMHNSYRYNLLGDPALALPNPGGGPVLHAATSDSLRTGRREQVVLVLSDHGLTAGPGTSYDLLVQESRDDRHYQLGTASLDYWQPGAPVFRGTGEAGLDTLRVPFKVPLQLRTGVHGRLRLIVDAPEGSRAAYLELPAARVATGGLDDVTGPATALAFAGGSTRVKTGAELRADLADSSGVSILGTTPLNSVLLEFDGTGQMNNVTDRLVFDSGSFTRARVSTPLPENLAPGPHRVALFASDLLGNVGSDTLSFHVVAEAVTGLQDVSVFPNPTSGPARLLFETSDPLTVTWTIFTVGGRAVWQTTHSFSEAGPQVLAWDGRDSRGDEIANGVYLYVVRGAAAGDAQHPVTVNGKIVLMK
ncbi:MAG: C25 family cysteine peptidase [Candidatus Latescibacteria bacterium]|nr:C25 family cysteine peptidase [Candidatus Latescibacterota bacterium]